MINRFEGQYAFLSNFAASRVTLDGYEYPTVEHAFQAAKTHDETLRAEIRGAYSPGKAKRLGRHVPLRPDWEAVKESVMWKLLAQKFTPETSFARELEATGGEPITEGTTWHDKYWGICTCERCGGQGRNVLGRMLMEIRWRNRNKQPLAWSENWDTEK